MKLRHQKRSSIIFLTMCASLCFICNSLATSGTIKNPPANLMSSASWVLLGSGANTGSCTSTSDCCTMTYCYGLEFTSGNNGTLNSYTTGFIMDCIDDASPVISNSSCIMTDNSQEFMNCSNGGVLMNSSGVNGNTPILANQPIIIHQVCFSIPQDQTLTLVEDEVTDISMAIDLTFGSNITEFPSYTPLVAVGNSVPDITVSGTLDACYESIEAAEAAALALTSATDICTSSPTLSSSTEGDCDIVITVTATDDCGLSSSVTFSTKIDGSIPIVNGGVPPTFINGCSLADTPAAMTTIPGILSLSTSLSITDGCTSAMDLVVTSEDENTQECPIVITRTYTLTDDCDNAAVFNHVIIINDEEAPVVVGTLADAIIDGCSLAVTPDAATSVAELEALDGEIEISDCNSDMDLVVTSEDEISGTCPAFITRTYTITDECENETILSHMITINPPDNIVEVGGPVNTVENITASAYAVAPAVLPTIEDGCGTILLPSEPILGGTFGDGDCQGTITYTYTYTDCAGRTYDWVYSYTVDCGQLIVKLNLEGAYSSGNGEMNTTLNELHLLPGQDKNMSGDVAIILGADFTPFGQPYQIAPWNYTGNLGDSYGDASSPNAPAITIPYPDHVVDWILVEVRKNGIGKNKAVFECAGWLHTNGDVTFPEACPDVLSIDASDDYYVIVEHRNHLAILDTAALSSNNGYLIMDFTIDNSYAPVFRNGQKEIDSGTWGMYSGNFEQNNSRKRINSRDESEWKLFQGTYGYQSTDANMDGAVNPLDRSIWQINQNANTKIKL